MTTVMWKRQNSECECETEIRLDRIETSRTSLSGFYYRSNTLSILHPIEWRQVAKQAAYWHGAREKWWPPAMKAI
jgi:hypothetical protein